MHYTTSCKDSLVLLRMGEIIARNMLIEITNELLLLHLVGCVYYCFSDARSHKHKKKWLSHSFTRQQELYFDNVIKVYSTLPKRDRKILFHFERNSI